MRVLTGVVVMMAISVAACSPAATRDTQPPILETSMPDVSARESTSGPVESTAPPQDGTASTVPSTLPADPERDNTALISLLSPVETLPDIVPGGWDPSHGAPYEAYVYERDGAMITILATYDEDDDIGRAMAFGEGVAPPDPEGTTVEGFDVLVYPQQDGIRPAVVHLDGVCGAYDLWVFGFVSDAAVLTQDAVRIAAVADCEGR
jgi:hypothetical protein